MERWFGLSLLWTSWLVVRHLSDDSASTMNYLHKIKSWRLNHPRGDPLKCACMQWGASGEIRRSWGPSRTRRCPHGPWSSGRGPWCRALSSRSRCSSWGSPRWSPPAASAAPLPGRCLAALPGPHRCWKKGRTCSFRESPLESDTVLLLKAQNEKKSAAFKLECNFTTSAGQQTSEYS